MAQQENLLENEEFVTRAVEAKNPEEFMEVLNDYSITLEEGFTPEQAFEEFKKGENGELKEGDLDNVSGGIGLTAALWAVGSSLMAGGGLSFFGNYAYQKYKNWKKRR